ncbi:ATP-binding cassette domain-containing protein [Alteromonas aestuariivivens]|uniref:ATP-binding cassette domain-containing protein n=1 Tax=Alteromonas aestuariivivens TaxID=1938339 RepID=A0A3D8M465_9ALTE|nr:ATP-binding cassette domain-containing protein [Alteromonas aestuariivivens]RDV24479.1 ATP-binding cassette domain-containing protein [Alteromonas aestuariivivens]
MKLALEHRVNPDFALSIEARFPGERHFLGLSGPSGAGKSTLLRVLAGLEKQASYHCSWFEDMPDRRVGLVFQDGLLFPHLSARENLALAMRYRKQPHYEWQDVVEGCQCAHLLDKQVSALSGGESQRVALARALLNGPDVLLLDEPLSALDLMTRHGLLKYLQRLSCSGLNILMVSHDLHDLALYCDAVGYVKAGKMQICDEPDAVLNELAHQGEYRQQQFGLLQGKRLDVTELDDYGCVAFECQGQTLYCRTGALSGEQVKMLVDARDVSLDRQPSNDSSIVNAFECEIVTVGEVRSGQVLLELARNSTRLYSLISQLSFERMRLRVGETVTARFKLR